jgi:hypothetical protein
MTMSVTDRTLHNAIDRYSVADRTSGPADEKNDFLVVTVSRTQPPMRRIGPGRG